INTQTLKTFIFITQTLSSCGNRTHDLGLRKQGHCPLCQSAVNLWFGCITNALTNREEGDNYIAMGSINALFVLGRTIGLVGHYLDQKRLKQPLYRHPWDDITYMSPHN
ncbi:jg17704, partial [Pararge aegeria aegeria]